MPLCEVVEPHSCAACILALLNAGCLFWVVCRSILALTQGLRAGYIGVGFHASKISGASKARRSARVLLGSVSSVGELIWICLRT